MRARLQHNAGVVKEVKVGFSWTTFFFGFFQRFFALVGVFTLGFGAWIPGIIFSFVYNKINIKDLLEKGYKPADEHTQNLLQSKGIVLQQLEMKWELNVLCS